MSKNCGCLFSFLSFLFPSSQSRNEQNYRETNFERNEYPANNFERNRYPESNFEYHYRSKYFLTKNEYYFYKALKPIADAFDLTILSKVRMADLVEPTCPYNSKQYKYSFAKIKSKHVDFVLADPANLRPKLLIELDDSSHDYGDRDEFVNAAYEEAGYKILHVRGPAGLEAKISAMLEK